MSKRPWMPFYPVDFQLDTLDLGPDEVGVYMIMICLAWRRGDGSLTGDMQELKIVLQRLIARFHGLTFNRIVPKLLERYFEKRADGRYYQKRVEKELRRAEELSEKQSRIATERWSKVNKNNDVANANALPSHSHSQSHTQEEDKKDSSLPLGDVSRETDSDWPKDYRERFWQQYPKHVGKKAALALLERIKKRGEVTFEQLMLGVSKIHIPTDPRFIPNATTWLNQGRWDDEQLPLNGAKNGTPTASDRAYEFAERIRELERAEGAGRPDALIGDHHARR